MAKTNRAGLDVLHVVSPVIPIYAGISMSAKVYDDLAASIVGSSPADHIVRAARARGADLIVMGTHGLPDSRDCSSAA